MPKITLEHLTKYYIDNKKKTAIAGLYDVNLVVPHASFCAIIGESGCGKTTLLKTIAGILIEDQGELYFDQKEINNQTREKHSVSYVSQEYVLYPNMTIFDNIAYPLKLQRVPFEEITRRVHEIATFLDIEILLSRKPKVLSGGQQQRVAIARALIRKTPILLLDEPLSNIDPQLKGSIILKIREWQMKYQMTVLYVTHQLEEVLPFSDEIIYMENGTVIKTEVNLSVSETEVMKSDLI